MARLILPREETHTRIPHPVNMRGWFRDGEKWTRLDHEITRCLQDGYHDWPGDPRYAIYAHPKPAPKGSWWLVRLEHDGVYRSTRSWPGDRYTSNFDFLAEVIRWVREHDTRAGFDVAKSVADHEARLERERDRIFVDRTEDFADVELWGALKRDKADMYA